MQLIVAGTRGSMPVCAPDRQTYGGDTTCLLVLGAGGEQVLIDAGTGLRHATTYLDRARPTHLLLTHFHLDHLTGLPTWEAIYTPDRELVLAAPPTAGTAVQEAVAGLLGPPYWPIALDDLPSRLTCRHLPPASGDEPWVIGGLEVRWTPIPHPGGCTSYRLDEPATGASLVVATDCEWGLASTEEHAAFVDLARGCDLLICDGQYEPEEMARRRGWGHTSWAGAADLASEVACAHLSLTHHDPLADDATLAAREARLQAVLPTADLARQGAVIELPGTASP